MLEDGSRQVHRVINGADMKCDPDNGYVVLWKVPSFTDLVLLHVKVTLKTVPEQRGVICFSFYVTRAHLSLVGPKTDATWGPCFKDSPKMFKFIFT